jgi:imidazolonepropionase-like amidohydrolase
MLLVAFALIATPSSAEVVVLRGARLIDGTGKAARQNAVLVIDGDRIATVGVAGKVTIPKDARVVDVKGRTIIPGLVNAHGHAGLVVEGQNRADAYTRENVEAQLVRY